MKINRNKNVCVPRLTRNRLIFRHKKTGHEVRFFGIGYLCGSKFYRERNCCLGCLQFGQGFTHHFLGKAGAFAALAGYAGSLADFLVAAASFIDRFADLSVGDASAEADIHKLRTVAGGDSVAMDLNVNENDCQSGF
ncbi:DNA-directed RNA polymerase [Pseudomonas sp. IT-P100]